MSKKQRQKSHRARQRTKRATAPPSGGMPRTIWLGAAAAVLAVVALIGVGLLLGSSDDDPIRNRAVTAPGRTLGPADAPVTIEYYEDFQCPACRAFTSTIGPRIEDDYVSKGLARVVFMHNAFIGPESLRAAEASECAVDQGRFWEYHDALFAAQGRENSGAFADQSLHRFADQLGLDMHRFDGCLAGGEHRVAVEQERQDAAERGVRVTPTIFINGTKVEGAGSYENLQRIIERELDQR